MPKPTLTAQKVAATPPLEVETVLSMLRKKSSKAVLNSMARYGIPSDRAFGVSMSNVQALARQLGKDHRLAGELWASGEYEARLLAAYVDDPAKVTSRQMDQWCRDFDNWAICDTVCFALFDRTPHAWSKVEPWSRLKEEFSKRTAFALLWGLSVHDKAATDELFVEALGLVEKAATDERHYVKKAVSMALRAIGKRNKALHTEAMAVARRLAASSNATGVWIGKDALKDLSKPALLKRLSGKSST
ncbi:MAG TPA: DNA alkylation repair protein [Candidatus Saccharimonadia bacterium]|nr:DNA alkylation repair protein [Candidatus Saccharimonadia bacterium]